MHPSCVLPALRHARFWREFLSALLFVSLLLPAHAAAPQWWAQRGVIAPDKARDDFAAINQGQLKNLAAKAVAEMNAKLTGGAGTALNQRVASWAANTAQADDFAGVNIGQAKAVARPVYERLLAAGAITALPSWITIPAASNQDFAAANIGQVKNLFAFEVPDQVGTSGAGGTNPETGPVLPANSPFVISYHGWRSGSLTPDLENTATVDTTGKVGFIRRYRWALTWGAETKPEKKLVSTHNEFLPTETNQESWKNDNTTSAESYRKIVVVMEPLYSDPENSSSILTQVKEHLRTYNINPSGESYTDQFITSYSTTADKNMALQRDGQTTYEVTEGTWTEAECQPLTVGQAPPSHFFKQEAHGPTPPAASNWTAAVPTVVSNPETVLQSPGAEIPYDSLILPSTGELLATADSILEKKVAYYRNSEGNFIPSERHIGRKSTGRIKIAWRTDLSPALTTELKQAWLSHFKVVTKSNYQYSGHPLNTHSSTVPLTQYLGVNSTQAVEIAHLSPHTQMGYQAHIELSLVPTSFVTPGTNPTPNPAEPDIGPPPPGKLVLFARQKEVKASAGSTSSAPSSFGILKLDESQPLSATSVVYLKKTTLRTQFVSIVEDTPLPEDISRPVYDSGEAIGTETIVHTGDIKDTYFNDYSFSESQEWINPIRIVPQPPNSFSEPDVQTQVERKHDRSRTKMRDVTISTQINTTSNILNVVRSTTITNVGYSLLDESSFAHDIKDVPGDSPPLVYTGEQSVNEFGSETKSWTKSWVDGEGNPRNESGGSTITYPTVSNQGTLTSLISEHSVFPDTDSVVDYDTPTRGGYSISLVDRGQVVGRSENSTELSVPLPWTSVDAAMRTQLAERPYPEWVRKGDVTSLSQIGQSVYECQFHPGEFSSKGSMLSWYLKHEAPTGTSAAQKAAMPPLTRLVYLLYKNPTGSTVHEEIKTLTVAPDQKSTVFEASALTDDLLPEGGTVTVSLLPIDLAVDSDNNDGLNPPKQDGAEDAKEDYLASQKPAEENPGKYIKLSTGDFDRDDTPDFADGMDIHDGSGADKCGKFVPMIADLSAIKSFTSAKVKFEYTAANPTGITKQTVPNDLPKWSPGSGDLRLWKKNGNEARKIADIKSNGDFVKANTEYSVTELGADSQGLLTLYVEAVRKSIAAADKAVTMFIKIDSQSQWIEADKVRFTAIPRVLFGSPYDELTPLPGSKIKPAFEDDTEAEGQELGGTVGGSNGDTLTVGHYGPHPDAESDETKDRQRLAICLQTGAKTFTKAEDGIVLLVADGATRGGSLAAAAPASTPPPSNDPPEVNGQEDWEAQFERILFDKYENANPRVEDLERDAFELWGWLYGGRSWEFFSGRDVWRDGSKIFIEDSLTPEQAADAYYAFLKPALPTEAEGVNLTPVLRYFAEIYEQSGEDRAKVGQHMAKHWELVEITNGMLQDEYIFVPVGFALEGVLQIRRVNSMTFYTEGKVFAVPLIRRNWARGNITEHDTLVNSLGFTRNYGKNAVKVTGSVNGQAVDCIPDAIRSQWYIEVKDWKSLSMTRQIRAEFSAAQNANKSVCIIITGRTRKLSQPLMQLIEQEGGLLIRRNLNTDGYEFWNFQTAAWEAVEKAIVKSWLP